MSHISKVECKQKITDKHTLINSLEMLKKLFVGMTYQESANGKIIQVHYKEIDDPVKNYHPEGNLRFSLTSDGVWEMSGDQFACREVYHKVCDAAKVCYLQSGAEDWLNEEGYTSSEETDEQKQVVVVARKW